ncbi:hypothetical protein [Streptomyces violascens]|uniref:Uncharacterized protein n=1 Tax=Streptomyces violascens TaxID=67381 RepID=A0ABQ3QTN3_9ACTN|nr:hypothetical protein [Streptomyces violascens]GHI40620.1 hypothetical protein Sviol_50280 [Streptomyces violascens]
MAGRVEPDIEDAVVPAAQLGPADAGAADTVIPVTTMAASAARVPIFLRLPVAVVLTDSWVAVQCIGPYEGKNRQGASCTMPCRRHV